MICDLQEFDSQYNENFTWGQLAEYLVMLRGWQHDFKETDPLKDNLEVMEMEIHRNLLEDESNA